MNLERIKEALNSRYINAAAVAVQVHPDKLESYAVKDFHHKASGGKYRNFTAQEKHRIGRIFEKLTKQISQTEPTETAIRAMLKNPVLKRSAIAEQLFPNHKPKAAAAAIANRINGVPKYRFSPEELRQVHVILQQVADLLQVGLQSAELSDGGATNFEVSVLAGKIDPNIFAPKKQTAGAEE